MEDQFDFFQGADFESQIIECPTHGRNEGTIVGFHSGKEDHEGCVVVDRICVLCLGEYMEPILRRFQRPLVGVAWTKGENVVEH